MVLSENSFWHDIQVCTIWPISSFRLVKPKLIQMHPNELNLCMEDIEGYWDILIHIINSL